MVAFPSHRRLQRRAPKTGRLCTGFGIWGGGV